MIADLHCDLLCYLKGDSKRTAYDHAVRCAIPQLKSGGVRLQIMAIYTDTNPNSTDEGLAQAQVFAKLPKLYPTEFRFVQNPEELSNQSPAIGIMAAIENASSFAKEKEPLQESLARFNTIRKMCGKIVYVSLTWNTENRFGGGAHSTVGLKTDGMQLIDFLQAKNIAIDLSHASDQLIIDIFNYLDHKKYQTPILASHSNFRKIADVPRNLPEEFAKEIMRREGLIGLNFIRSFIGEKDHLNLARQLEYGLEIGGANHLCFGADFYHLEDIPLPYRKPPDAAFFPEFSNAGDYAKVLKLWKNHLTLPDDLLYDISYGNLQKYLSTKIL